MNDPGSTGRRSELDSHLEGIKVVLFASFVGHVVSAFIIFALVVIR